MTATIHKKHVLIIGGGFAGVKAALELCDNPHFAVALLSDRPNFRYYPALYHTATGGRERQSSIKLEQLFAGKAVRLLSGEAVQLDREQKSVQTADGQHYTYDILVLALGVVTNYFGIPGLADYAYGIKSLEDATAFRQHLHEQLADTRQPDLNYVIAGGGPTGIELAGALPHYLRRVMKNHGIRHRAIHIDLVEAAPHLMPTMPRAMGRRIEHQLRQLGIKLYLEQMVQGETADSLQVNGKPITSHSVVWTAGMANHPFFKANNFTLGAHGKVQVDKFLQAEPHMYVLGDNADTSFSGMAQTAVYDGEFLAANLKRQAAHKPPRAYRPKRPIYIMPAGRHWAAVLWGHVQLYGRLGWWLRQLADLEAFRDIESLPGATEQWLNEFGEQESCPICAGAAK